MTSHTRKWKESEVTRLQQLAKKHPVIAIADLKGFPANLYGALKVKLAGKAVMTVSKRKIIQRALEKAGIEAQLKDNVKGSSAVIFSDINPFELFSVVKQATGKITAKVGQIAPEDIMIPAGDTGLPPGPALSELKAAGLNVKMQGQTIHITEDKIVVHKGEPINAAVANVLTKLGIKPIRLRLNLTNALEGTQLFPAGVLDINEEEIFLHFVKAEQSAFNLSVNAVIFTEKATPYIIQKAFREAKAVALEGNILAKGIIEEIISKAQRAAQSIKYQIKEEVPAP